MSQTKRTGVNKTRLLKVVLLGDGGVGKSCLMNRFVSNKFDSQSYHTIGVEFLNKEISVGGTTVTLQIWDTAGQERFKSLRTPFYRGADCCLLTFGLNDMASFKSLSMWKTEFLHYADVSEATSFPFVLLGNKVDLPDREVSHEGAVAWSRSQDIPYFETSAKDAINVDAAFHAAVTRIIELERHLDRRLHTETIDLAHGSSQKGGCC